MGITTWDDPSRYGLSLTLGGGDITMLDMATVYGAFANMGHKEQPIEKTLLKIIGYTIFILYGVL